MGSELLSPLKEFQQRLHKLIEELRSSRDPKKIEARFDRWEKQFDRWLLDNFGQDESGRFSEAVMPNQVAHHPAEWCFMQMKGANAFIESLVDDIESGSEAFTTPSTADISQDGIKIIEGSVSKNLNPKKVFIVHGHDELNLLRLTNIVRDEFKLDPIVLKAKAGAGRTLIEKLEQEGSDAAYAFVLMTPDDVIAIEGSELFQSRPNVLFELGWFYGRLGRPRVCIVFKKGTQIPSDLDGVERVEFTDSPDEKVVAFRRELKKAGML